MNFLYSSLLAALTNPLKGAENLTDILGIIANFIFNLGVPVAVINTPYIQRMGLKAGPLSRWMLRGHRTKHWMRTFYALKSIWQLKRSSLDETGAKDYWQAGKSVAGIHDIEPAGEIVKRFQQAVLKADG